MGRAKNRRQCSVGWKLAESKDAHILKSYSSSRFDALDEFRDVMDSRLNVFPMISCNLL